MSVTFAAEHAPEHLQINMSNTNAAMICEALGLSLAPDYCGDMPAEAFLGRVLLALAICPEDDGMPSYEHTVVGTGPRVIEGSRRSGYLQERLQQLHALGTHAVTVRSEVWWT